MTHTCNWWVKVRFPVQPLWPLLTARTHISESGFAKTVNFGEFAVHSIYFCASRFQGHSALLLTPGETLSLRLTEVIINDQDLGHCPMRFEKCRTVRTVRWSWSIASPPLWYPNSLSGVIYSGEYWRRHNDWSLLCELDRFAPIATHWFQSEYLLSAFRSRRHTIR